MVVAESDKSYYSSYSNDAIRWLAPELIGSLDQESILDDSDGDSDLLRPNSQSDIFSLGCIMLHVFSGRLPFWWLRNIQQVLRARFKHVEPYRVEPTVTVSHQHLDFMRKCWSAKPEDRPSTEDAASFGRSSGAVTILRPVNSVDNTAASADSATPPSTIPVVPEPGPSITMQPDALLQRSPQVRPVPVSDITVLQPDASIGIPAPQVEVQFDLPIPSKTVDENLAPGAVTILQSVTPGTNEAQPLREASDANPFAIPSTSIKRQSDYPTSSSGLGDIWKCSMIIDPESSTEVAVKSIRTTDIHNEDAIQKAKKRLCREVAAWIELRHAHVLALHGTVSGFGPLPALVSTWMHDEALDAYLERTSLTLTMVQKLQLLKQVVDGLIYLHEREVIHGDLTSTNVMIDRDGNAFLTNFGLSVVLAESDRSYYRSYSSSAVRWLAPELISSPEPESIPDDSDSNVDFPKPNSQSDVFSLGCIMLHVFSGRLPFWWLGDVRLVFGARLDCVEPYQLEHNVIISYQHLDFMGNVGQPSLRIVLPRRMLLLLWNMN
ncbi:kinase-like domain-containing protein, partial [Suillus subaureus]